MKKVVIARYRSVYNNLKHATVACNNNKGNKYYMPSLKASRGIAIPHGTIRETATTAVKLSRRLQIVFLLKVLNGLLEKDKAKKAGGLSFCVSNHRLHT